MADATFTLAGIGAAQTVVSTNGFDAAALIKNTGPNPLYASAAPITDPSQGFPIDSGGGTLTWPQGRPLYLIAAGGTTTAVIDPGNGDGATSSPADQAQALIAAGLAKDIADSIYSTGIRSVDQPIELLSFAGTLANLQVLLQSASTTIDVSEYNSLRISLSINGVGGGSPGAGDIQTLMVGFVDGSTTIPPGGALDQRLIEGNALCEMLGQVPVTGSGMWLEFDSTTANFAAYNTCTLTVMGSLRNVQNETWSVQNAAWEDAAGAAGAATNQGTTSLLVTPPVGGALQTYWPSWVYRAGGPGLFWSWVIVSGNASNATSGSRALLETNGSTAIVSGSWTNSTATDAVQSFTGVSLGTRQPKLLLQNMSTTASIGYSVVLSYY